VAFAGVTFLPPMEDWFSGAIPYPVLLFLQAVIIVLFTRVAVDFTRGRGLFAVPRPRLGRLLTGLGLAYLGVMVVRYVVRMSLFSHERWTGGSIPIFFHWVLASFLLTVAQYHRRSGPPPPLRRLPWIAFTTAVVLAMLVWTANQAAPRVIAHRLGVRPGQFAVRVSDRTMTTSDGVPLVARVFRPQHLPKTPTILIRLLFAQSPTNRLLSTLFGRLWAEHGYTVVVQFIRGAPPSGGQYYPLRGERRDGIETLRWIAAQDWYDGRIGTWGGSYFGYTQWVLADQERPGPSAMMIQLASTDFHKMLYPGGAFALESALFWSVRSRGGGDVIPGDETLDRALGTLPVTEADDRAGGDIPSFDDWARHPGRDGYWAAIDGEDRAGQAVAPAFLMSGWYDPFLPTLLADHARLRARARPGVAAETRLIIGPWAHATTVRLPDGQTPGNYRLDSLAPSIAWFDRHLHPAGAPPVPASPPVRLFVMGRNQWRDEKEWPLARARPQIHYLSGQGRPDGRLVPAPPGAEPPDTFVYDPRDPVPTAGGAMLGFRAGIQRQNAIEARGDVLVYTSPPLPADLEVTGVPALELTVATTAPATDFMAKLVDVYPDGAAYNVCDGVIRRTFTPATPTSLRIELGPTSMVFRAGHRLRLEVTGSNFPHYDRNPNTGAPAETATAMTPATQTLFHGAEAPARLILPVVP
jgi:putative CocE/NonD family hydrolase